MEFYIRPVKKEDLADIADMRRMPGVFENILGNPAVRETEPEDFLRKLGDNRYQFSAVIKEGNESELVIGTADLTLDKNPRKRHSGYVGILVHKDYQNMGVGTALMAAIVDMADNWLKLVRLELDVFEDNERAIALYEKFGFEIEGLKRCDAIRKGEYVSSYVMSRINL